MIIMIIILIKEKGKKGKEKHAAKISGVAKDHFIYIRYLAYSEDGIINAIVLPHPVVP